MKKKKNLSFSTSHKSNILPLERANKDITLMERLKLLFDLLLLWLLALDFMIQQVLGELNGSEKEQKMEPGITISKFLSKKVSLSRFNIASNRTRISS